MANILKKVGFKGDIAPLYDDIFNVEYYAINPSLVPYGKIMYYASNNVLYGCKLIATLYNLKYNDKEYFSALLIERMKEDGSTCYTIIGAPRGCIFESEEDYVKFKQAKSADEADMYVPEFVKTKNNIQFYKFVRAYFLNKLDFQTEGFHSNVAVLWEWYDYNSTAISVHPNLDLVWVDSEGVHCEDTKGFFANTDKYFKTKSACVEAHRPKVIEFGKPIKTEDVKEYTIEVSVKVKAKSYEEALKISQTYTQK